MISIVRGLLFLIGLLRSLLQLFGVHLQQFIEFFRYLLQSFKNKDVNSFLYYLISNDEAFQHKKRQNKEKKRRKRILNFSKTFKAYKKLLNKQKKGKIISLYKKVKSKKIPMGLAKKVQKIKIKKIKNKALKIGSKSFKSKKIMEKKDAIKSAVKHQMKKQGKHSPKV